MNTGYLLNIFLLIVCVALTVLCGNTNQRLRRCLTDDNSGNDDNDDEDSSEKSCKAIQDISRDKREKILSQQNVTIPKNVNFTILQESFMFSNLFIYTARTKKYNINGLRLMTTYDPDDLIYPPMYLGNCLVMADLKRDENIEQLLLSYLNNPKNKPEEESILAHKYYQYTGFVVFLNYQKYNKLDLYKPSTERLADIDATLYTDFKYQSYPTDPAVMTLPTGFYNNGGEVGFVFKRNASSFYATLYTSSLPFIGISDRLVNNKRSSIVDETLVNVYRRIFFTVRGQYMQLRGFESHVTKPDLRFKVLQRIAYLYAYRPTEYFLPIEVHDELLNDPSYMYSCVVSKETIDKADKMFDDLRVVSRCEGFAFYSNSRFIFEQACTSPYLDFTPGDLNTHGMKYNIYYVTGYINYGCDYVSFVRTVNEDKSFPDLLLPGQVIIKTDDTRGVPSTATLVKLDKNLYFQSTHVQDPIRVNGILDGETATHRIFVRVKAEYRYCAFGWVSVDAPIITKTKDDRYVLFDADTRISVKAEDATNKPYQLTQKSLNLIDGKRYNYFLVDASANNDLHVTVSFDWSGKNDNGDIAERDKLAVKRIKDYEVINGLEAGMTIQPKADVPCTVVKNRWSKQRFVVDESLTLNSDNPTTLSFDSKTYQFSDTALGRVAIVST